MSCRLLCPRRPLLLASLCRHSTTRKPKPLAAPAQCRRPFSFSFSTSTRTSTMALTAKELNNYFADAPPSVVRLEIGKHFAALSDRQKRYSHYISL